MPSDAKKKQAAKKKEQAKSRTGAAATVKKPDEKPEPNGASKENGVNGTSKPVEEMTVEGTNILPVIIFL